MRGGHSWAHRRRTRRAAGIEGEMGAREHLGFVYKVAEVAAHRVTWSCPHGCDSGRGWRAQAVEHPATPGTAAACCPALTRPGARGDSGGAPRPRPCAFMSWPRVTLEHLGGARGLHSIPQEGRATRTESVRLGPWLALWNLPGKLGF